MMKQPRYRFSDYAKPEPKGLGTADMILGLVVVAAALAFGWFFLGELINLIRVEYFIATSPLGDDAARALLNGLAAMDPAELDRLDADLANLQRELEATAAEMDAWLEANR